MNVEDSYKYFEEAFDSIRDIFFYLPYIPNEEYEELHKLSEQTKRFRNNLKNEIPSELLALKLYTEGKVSWERAGELCDLGIFGLRNYCEEHNVEVKYLRIDEYYGMDGEECINKIKEEWSKLDPNGLMQPINYTGSTKKYSSLEEKTTNENINILLQILYYNMQGKYLLSSFIYNIYQLNLLDKNIQYYETLLEITKGLQINNIEELHYLKIYLTESLKQILDKPNNISTVMENLISYFNDEYYYYTIKI